MHNPLHPPTAPLGFGTGKVVAEEQASFLSKLVFQWLSPFLNVGFSRPLQKEDLWELPPHRLTNHVTDILQANFYARCSPEKRPAFLRDQPRLQSDGDRASPALSDDTQHVETSKESESNNTEKKSNIHEQHSSDKGATSKKEAYKPSLVNSILSTFAWQWWIAGSLKLFADTLNTTTPLVTKVLLSWLSEAYVWYRLPPSEKDQIISEGGITVDGVALKPPRGIGYGIGLAFAIFIMQEVSSLMTNQYMTRSMTTGLTIRTGVIGTIFRKSLRLSNRSRAEYSVGRITTMISTDATRLDHVCWQVHNLWVSLIQIAIGIGLLINNLGYSALVGLGVLVLGFPVQFILIFIVFTQRRKSVSITDGRVRLTNEILQGIRLIKVYVWEMFYVQQVTKLRMKEIRCVKIGMLAISGLIATMTFIPVLASILSFITYALTRHDLNVAVIFSSLQYFNIIRAPLIMLPMALQATADALVALGRISNFLLAEEQEETYNIDEQSKFAIQIDGDFAWETAGKLSTAEGGVSEDGGGSAAQKQDGGKNTAIDKKNKSGKWKARKEDKNMLPTTSTEEEGSLDEKENSEKPFELRNLHMQIPKGLFVAIVGQVGSGKSSLFQALIGEMRKYRGDVTFGGNVAYVPQAPWIMNCSLRQNIEFGQEGDEQIFREIVRACSLEPDLKMLPNGEETEIGEKGINLSGGQKARVSLARAAYSQPDIVLLDDCLSAVDAYVGKAILEKCLLTGPLARTTRLLVTHALHVLPKVDYIYVMENGAIVEQGSYESLMKSGTLLSRTLDTYGSVERQPESGPTSARTSPLQKSQDGPLKDSKNQAPLMQDEERSTGAVPFSIYARYFKHAGGLFWAPLIFVLMTLAQGASVANNLFLGFWTSQSISGFTQSMYMGVYAALGAAMASFSFAASLSFSFTGLYAGLSIFKGALIAVLRSPVSFFDTTPMGRIVSRLSKDQDTIDTQLAFTLYAFLSNVFSVLGTVALVFYTFPYLGIIFAPLAVCYYFVQIYYRRSSVETKRLDSLMRSALYASYTETLSGLSTVRAYRDQSRFVRNTEQGLDLENRAYYMTITIQRWLSVRLDFFGNILILGIGLFAAGFRNHVNPSKIGVVLSYSLSITQVLSEVVSTFASNEQNMNAVERLLVYTDLPAEGNTSTPEDPPPSWPEQGGIQVMDVDLAYREGLPPVLKDVSFEVRPREKIGVVGRTGAGKSSLLQALFRMVEIQSGKIEIDGRNIQNMGLDALRSRLALVPQDSVLFLGTLRENLDPQASRTDAELIEALGRVWLLPKDGESMAPSVEAKFSLDSPVSDDGANYSAGEKQLLALCRALVKKSRIIVLDEATSSVDVETDAKVQRTIQTEFSESTLICIAHRLNTIVYYDRILVMDAGRVAEFDTPLNLFDQEDSIFRSLCDEASLSRHDILRIRAEA